MDILVLVLATFVASFSWATVRQKKICTAVEIANQNELDNQHKIVLNLTETIKTLEEKINESEVNENAALHKIRTLSDERDSLSNSFVEITKELEVLSSSKSALEKENIELLDKNKILENELANCNIELSELREKSFSTQRIQDIKNELEAYENEHELIAVGLYPLSLTADTPDDIKARLEDIRDQLAVMVRNKAAAVCSTKWTINGSESEGSRATRHYIRIMLRTFNADADACLGMVRWNNLDKCIVRVMSSFNYVNQLGSSHATIIQKPYMELRIEQLRLMHQYREALYKKKELMRAARQAAREERRAQREIEQARAEAEKEEARYSQALDKARKELALLDGNERERMLLRISELEESLQIASALKQRAISMAQITKAGFVYVISNIGSFGEGVLKIGMTRRIDPHERIRELGGASVPFGFDVHAMIYSENAPDLENKFHRHFSRERINLANGRKEFFRASLASVVEFAETLDLKAEFASDVEARDFRISQKLRDSVFKDISDEELEDHFDALDKIEATLGDDFDEEDDDD